MGKIKPDKTKCCYKGVSLPDPSKQEVRYWNDVWDKYNFTGTKYDHDKALDSLFSIEDLSKPTTPQKEYVKCCTLNHLYSTNIKYMDGLVYKIFKNWKKYKVRIKKPADIKLIDDMKKIGNYKINRKVYSIKTKNKDSIDYISFCSKYCRRYNPKDFPIYDGDVNGILKAYNNGHGFNKDGEYVDNNWENNYEKFVAVVDAFIKWCNKKGNIINEKNKYVKLDHWLWAMAKAIKEYIEDNKKQNKTTKIKIEDVYDFVKDKFSIEHINNV